LNLFRHIRIRVNASAHATGGVCAAFRSRSWRFRIARLVAYFVLAAVTVFGDAQIHARQISFPRPDVDQSISVSSSRITRWRQGEYEILHLTGGVKIQQQPINASADEAIIWVETPTESAGKEHKVIVYLEKAVVIDLDREGPDHTSTGASSDRIVDEKWLGRFFTRGTVDLDQVTESLGNDLPPAIFARAQAALAGGDQPFVQQTGFVSPQQSVVVSPQTGVVQQITPTFQTPPIGAPPNQVVPAVQGARENQSNSGSPFKVQISGRDSSVDLNTQSIPNPNNPNEFVTTFVGGIRIVIESPLIANAPQFQRDQDRKLYILANNMVQWQTTMPDGSKRNQFYLEGDVVFAKGSRVIYSERMYYYVEAQQGTIL
jgi:lipopolysaccharide export system protein LptA